MPDALYRCVDACRSCGSQRLSTVLDLGEPFISDFLLPGETGIRAPIEVTRCEDCTLVQTRHTVDREILFRDYHYLSGTNESMVAALRDVVEDAERQVHLEHHDAVLDIGSNDGTLLRQWPVSVARYGVEPSDLWSQGLDAGPIYHAYFPDEFQVPDGPFKVITSIAMFYAQDEPHAFVAAIKRRLHSEGVWVVQLQDLASVLRDRAFDYFCHEHLCLYSLHSFERLIHEHGLEIQDWSTHSVNGGSLRIIVGHGSKLKTSVRPEDEPQAWTDFATAIEGLRSDTMGLLRRLKDAGMTVHGLAASTKGNTLLQYYGLTPELLPVISERQPAKWGRRTVGTNIPIVSEEESRAAQPDYYVALAWHFADSFERRESTPLILPLPQLEVRSRPKVAV